MIEIKVTKEEALACLRNGLGNDSIEFRDGQWEAIDGVLRGRRQLVVQRTGWGKSVVYFLAAKFLRDAGRGMTLLISPLLALMRNQIDAAKKLGLRIQTINSTNVDEWQRVTCEVVSGEVDLLLVSPERLSNEGFQANVLDLVADKIGFMVVDEAHCISDWGHDFRPDYKRISRILRNLPKTMPVLATTATANLRVCEDVKQQLGDDIDVIRGPLVRKSLFLQNIQFNGDEEKLVWLADTLKNRLTGCGIVYTLTTLEAERVAGWLRSQGITAFAYYGAVQPSPDMSERMRKAFEASLPPVSGKYAGEKLGNAYRVFLENVLIKNRIRVLVASSALGMGFDKPDLAFVIHYQRPKSVVDYYQQVGRAGRNIDRAYGILLADKNQKYNEDDRIANYFIKSAFPTKENVDKILYAIKAADEGISKNELLDVANIRAGALEQVLKFLTAETPQPVVQSDRRYMATPFFESYKFPFSFIERIMSVRFAERDRMRAYVATEECLMKFLCDELDSNLDGGTCGNCAKCNPSKALPTEIDKEKLRDAALYLAQSHQALEPRKQWADAESAKKAFGLEKAKISIPKELMMNEGRVLSTYNVGFYGKLVALGRKASASEEECIVQGNYRVTPGRYDDYLVKGCVSLLKKWNPQPFPKWVTVMPSLRGDGLVEDFARRLSDMLRLPFYVSLVKGANDCAERETMQNSIHQQRNLMGAYAYASAFPREECLLVDDTVDSRWELTIASAMLRKAGVASVTPIVLAEFSAGSGM